MVKQKSRIPVAISIAGSDSGGGAGIQADLKTFAVLGVHGTTAITAVTAQNTMAVVSVEDLKPEMIRTQIRVVAEDLGIDAGKTGMLHTREIIKTVAEEVSKYRFPLVVDPVMVAKSGSPLLIPEAVDALKSYLLPKTTVVTPNRFEAEKLADAKIEELKDVENVAKKISMMGPKAIVIKGGHLEGKEAIDILYHEGRIKTFKAQRIDSRTTHGTGCSFSAAIAAELAKKTPIPVAVEKAKEIVTLGIKFGLTIGNGYGPVNPLAHLYRESSRYSVLMNVENAKKYIEASPEAVVLVPEVGMNIAMAIPYAENIKDIAAIEGRIVKTLEGAKAVGNAKFGCSSHLAKYILEIRNHDERKVAAINFKFSEKILKILEKRGMIISFYDRREEPEKTKKVEGMTIPWGVKEAIRRIKKAPDAIYHRGDVGKESMIVLFGEQAFELANLVTKVASEVEKE
ncbi:MAG: bifunctional hydroxymethylpyrimidine kinase/phosphomethylpyrimidine kinase [Candidatus Bathyarchaeota archaeon]|nr:bifunctional hydroxymethylpyrimidine kinase/phosphomethylpyrimidine kinase [Candidatus Bathyarchaeota archaeon]MDH5788576.1 bifunctional hydroxymethylpyrimidine kinase/phosphomethylpyrimidine kinase [Candidatus Bathyarchaeota archaeon]